MLHPSGRDLSVCFAHPKVPHFQPRAWKGCLWIGAPGPHCCPWAVLAVQWPAVILASSVPGTTRPALPLEPGQLEVGAHFPFHCPGQCPANWTVSKCLLSEWVSDKLASEGVTGPVSPAALSSLRYGCPSMEVKEPLCIQGP